MKLIPAKIATLLAAIALGATFAGHTARAEEKSPLDLKMDIIAKSVKQLKNQVTDPKQQQSSITLVEAAKQAATDAKQLVPSMAASIPECRPAEICGRFPGATRFYSSKPVGHARRRPARRQI